MCLVTYLQNTIMRGQFDTGSMHSIPIHSLIVTVQQFNIQNMSKFKDNHMAHFGLIEDIHNLMRRSH